jgi:hypothetical protein
MKTVWAEVKEQIKKLEQKIASDARARAIVELDIIQVMTAMIKVGMASATPEDSKAIKSLTSSALKDLEKIRDILTKSKRA